MDNKMGSGSRDDITDHDPLKNPAQRGKDWRKNVEMLSGKKKKAKNVLTRMEAYAERGGPFSMLSRCVNEKLKIKVWTRSYKHVRGICTGFLVAYDRHMNLAMYDVDEVYKNPVSPPSEKKKPRKRIRKKKLHATTVKAESQNDDVEVHQANPHLDISLSSVKSTTKQGVDKEIRNRKKSSTVENSDALTLSARSSKDSSQHIGKIHEEPLDLSVDRSVEEEIVCSVDQTSTSKVASVSYCRDFILNLEVSGSNVNTETKSLQTVDFKSLFHRETGKDTNLVMKRMEGLSCSEAVTSYSSSLISACTSGMSDIGSTSVFISPTGSSDSSVTCTTSCAVTTLNENVNSVSTSSQTSDSKDLTVLSHIPGSICCTSTQSVLSADNKDLVTSLDIRRLDSSESVSHDKSIGIKTGEVLSFDVAMHGEITETGEGSKTRSSKCNKGVNIKQESNNYDVGDNDDVVDDVDDTSDVEELMNEMKNIRAALEALDSSSDSNDDNNDDDSNYGDDFNYDDDNYSHNCSASDNDSYDLYNQFYDNVDHDSENDNNNNDNERRESSYSSRYSSSINQQPGPPLCTSGKNSSIEEKLVALASNQQSGNSDALSISSKSSEQAKDRKKQSATRASATTIDEKDSELRKDNPYALSISSSERSIGRKKQSSTKSDKKDLELQKDIDTETEEGEIEDTECEEGEIASEEEAEVIKEDRSRLATGDMDMKHGKTDSSDLRKCIDKNKAGSDRQLKKGASLVQELRQDHCDRKRTKSSVDYNRNSKVLPDGQGSSRRQSGVKDSKDRYRNQEESQKSDSDQLGRRKYSTTRRNDIRGNTSKIDDTNINRSKNSKVTTGKADETNFRSNRGKDRSSTITAESLVDRLRSDPINKGSVGRNDERYEAVLTRHVNQLFIRGDNVVMVAVASITD